MSSDEATAQAALQMISSFIPNLRGRRPANLPALTDANGKALPRYLVEKSLGLRRENGAMKLKRLTARHLKILGMHLEGKSLENICMECNITMATASRVLNDPLAVAILKRVYTSRESEIQALGGKAIAAVRDGLTHDSMGVKLRAVDKYAKLREVMLPKGGDRETAEDVIQRMLSQANFVNSNVQINIGAPNETLDSSR